jgi:hypothetical protein
MGGAVALEIFRPATGASVRHNARSEAAALAQGASTEELWVFDTENK